MLRTASGFSGERLIAAAVVVLLASGLSAGAARLHAQQPRRGSIRGVVYDSSTRRPIAGATVFTVSAMHFAATDSAGNFVLDTVPAGRYALDVAHPRLDSLGFAIAASPVEIGAGEERFVVLGVPSLRTLTQALCGDSLVPPDLVGVIHGVVTDAATGEPVPGARVVASWLEIAVSRGGPPLTRTIVRRERVTTARGGYVMCGVPVGTSLTLAAHDARASSGDLDVAVGGSGFVAQSLVVAPAAASSAVLRGTVMASGGRPLDGAVVSLAGDSTHLARTGPDGAFTLAGLPAGSRTIEVRAIGYVPERSVVALEAGRDSRASLTVGERANILPAVEVTAAMADPTGFERRRRGRVGHFISRQDIERRDPNQIADMFDGMLGIVMVPGGHMLSDARIAGRGGRACEPSFLIDGAWTGGPLPVEIDPSEVESLEVYRGSFTPSEFNTRRELTNCGAIVLWTRRGVAAAKRRAAEQRDRERLAAERTAPPAAQSAPGDRAPSAP